LSVSVIKSVTGATSRTVATLSRKAGSTAVTRASITRMPQGSALTFLADHTARYWKTPDLRVMATMTIIPVKSPRVLKSTPATACCWVRTPARTMTPAASMATMARLMRSVITGM
jgi:hypothetical protein